jgi:hypothetical protein
MSSPGPGLRLERPKACGTDSGTFIRQPVVEKIRVVIIPIPRGQMKKNIFHREFEEVG